MRLGLKLRSFIEKPILVFCVSISILILNLVFSGSLLRLYKLSSDEKVLISRIEMTHQKIEELNQKIQKAKDPEFIERQAVELYDLAQAGDLVFQFADN